MAFLYFKNTTTTGVWNDVTNWFEDDACTIQATNVPWVAGDSTYLGYDLTRSSASVTAEDIIYINVEIGNGVTITGTCDITVAGSGHFYNNNGNSILGGTWSGSSFNNDGTIGGGIFSGDNFANTGFIVSGTFSGDYFANSNIIYGGTFTGDFFDNASSGIIYGGTFSGDTYSIQGASYIYGGTFSGDSGSSNGEINGGIFTGNGFYNYYIINSGVFSGDNFINQSAGEINGGIFTGNGSSNSGSIFSGSWLESGFLDIDIFDYSSGSSTPTITGQIRIKGTVTNPYKYDLATQQGFMTLKIKGQDVLGTGLL